MKVYEERARIDVHGKAIGNCTWSSITCKLQQLGEVYGPLVDICVRKFQDKMKKLENSDIYFLNSIIGIVKFPFALGAVIEEKIVQINEPNLKLAAFNVMHACGKRADDMFGTLPASIDFLSGNSSNPMWAYVLRSLLAIKDNEVPFFIQLPMIQNALYSFRKSTNQLDYRIGLVLRKLEISPPDRLDRQLFVTLARLSRFRARSLNI